MMSSWNPRLPINLIILLITASLIYLYELWRGDVPQNPSSYNVLTLLYHHLPSHGIRITMPLSIGSAGHRSSSNEVHEDRTAEFLFNSIDCLWPSNPSSYVTSPHWPRDANCKPIIIIDSFTCSPQFRPTCTRSHISQMYTPNWFNLDVN